MSDLDQQRIATSGQAIVCGNTCGHDHESPNGPSGCCQRHGPYMYFCRECQDEWAMRAAAPAKERM